MNKKFKRNLEIWFANRTEGQSYTALSLQYNMTSSRVGQICVGLDKYKNILDKFSTKDLENNITVESLFAKLSKSERIGYSLKITIS